MTIPTTPAITKNILPIDNDVGGTRGKIDHRDGLRIDGKVVQLREFVESNKYSKFGKTPKARLEYAKRVFNHWAPKKGGWESVYKPSRPDIDLQNVTKPSKGHVAPASAKWSGKIDLSSDVLVSDKHALLTMLRKVPGKTLSEKLSRLGVGNAIRKNVPYGHNGMYGAMVEKDVGIALKIALRKGTLKLCKVKTSGNEAKLTFQFERVRDDGPNITYECTLTYRAGNDGKLTVPRQKGNVPGKWRSFRSDGKKTRSRMQLWTSY